MPPLNSSLSRGKRVCIVGDPGAGKTALMGQLARHYETFILDADDLNLPLREFVPAEFHPKFHLEPIRDAVTIDSKSGRLKPIGEPKAWKRAIELLGIGWTDSETKEAFGNVQQWGTDRAIVVDSWTHIAVPCWNYTLYLNSTDYADRFSMRKRQVDWGDAIDRQTSLLHLLTKCGLKCHVVILTHLKHLTIEEALTEEEANALSLERAEKRVKSHAAADNTNAQLEKVRGTGSAAEIALARRKEQEDRQRKRQAAQEDASSRSTVSTFKRYPVALGQKLPESFGSYFDFVVQAKRGKDGVPYIQTTPDPDVDLKCPALSSKIPAVLPLENAIHTLLSL